MGHATENVIVRVNEVPEEETSVSRGYSGYATRRSLHERVASAALRMWNDDYDNYGSASLGSLDVLPMVPQELMEDGLDRVNSYRTVVIPLMRKEDYEVKTKTITVNLDGEEWAEYLNPRYDISNDVIWKHLKEAFPSAKDSMFSFRVENDQKLFASTRVSGWNLRSTVVADAGGGKAVTLYHLKVVDARRGVNYSELSQKGFETQAIARAEGVKMMKENDNVLSVEVVPVTKREDGTNLVKISRKVSKATAKITVSYVKVKAKKPTHDRWIVGFDVHS